MTLLEWKTEYSVGVAAVDDEHRELIQLINALYAHLDERSNSAEIEKCLGAIHNAIAMHFALEERMMQEHGYDQFAEHKDDHEDLLDQLLDLMDGFVLDPASGQRALEEQLSSWFADHFSTHDARLHGKLGI